MLEQYYGKNRELCKDSSKAMLNWQYFQLLNQLGQVELHAGDSTCPCTMADSGEYCIPKHLGLVSSLASETAAMDSKHSEVLFRLGESAVEMHKRTKAVYEGTSSANIDVVTWARNWRKDEVEPMYYKSKRMLKRGLECLNQEFHLNYLYRQEKNTSEQLYDKAQKLQKIKTLRSYQSYLKYMNDYKPTDQQVIKTPHYIKMRPYHYSSTMAVYKHRTTGEPIVVNDKAYNVWEVYAIPEGVQIVDRNVLGINQELHLSDLYPLEKVSLSPEEKVIPEYSDKIEDCVTDIKNIQKALFRSCPEMFNKPGIPKQEAIGETCEGQVLYDPYAVCRASLQEYYRLTTTEGE